MVVVARVFGRSWSPKPGGWYKSFLDDPRGTIQVGDREIRIRAVVVQSELIPDAVEDAYVGHQVLAACGRLRAITMIDRFRMFRHIVEPVRDWGTGAV